MSNSNNFSYFYFKLKIYIKNKLLLISIMEETNNLDVKITKKNMIKVIVDTFNSNIDLTKEDYTLNDLKNILTDAFKSVKDKKKEAAVKKNPSAYNIFVKQEMQKIKSENPDLGNKEILAVAAKKWQEQKAKK